MSPWAMESDGLLITSVGRGEAGGDLDLGAQVAADRDRLQRNPVIRSDRRDLEAILAEQQRAGRQAQRVRAVGQLEMDLGIGTTAAGRLSGLSACNSTSRVRDDWLMACDAGLDRRLDRMVGMLRQS